MRKAQEEDQSLHNIRRKCEHREVDNTLNTCTNCAYICSDPLPIHTLPTMSVANYIVIPAHGTLCSSCCWLQIGLAPYSLYS